MATSASVYNLVKEMLPDAIKRTERGTFVYKLDGEDHAFPSYRTAAHSLGQSLGLGKRHVASEEIHSRLGERVKVLYTAPQFDARDMRTPPLPPQDMLDAERKLTAAPPAPTEPQRRMRKPREPRKPSGTRQPRSTRVTLPQRAVAELLRTGKVRILLAVT